jgi:anti-sigma factor RsiW
MNPQHLSDEAVAAFADGVLTGHARERATRHINSCGECRHAVNVQREAAFALRAAAAPPLPSALLDRLRTVPQTTPISTLPTALGPDGTTMLSTLPNFAPMAALVPNHSPRGTHRMRPFVTTAAIVALAGTLAAGSVARQDASAQTGTDHAVRHATPDRGGAGPALVNPVSFFRGAQP